MILPTTSSVPLAYNADFSAPAWNYPEPPPSDIQLAFLPAVEKSRKDRLAAIEAQGWLLSPFQLPGKEVLDVTGWYKNAGLLSEREVEIVESEATRVLEMVKGKRWTSLEVVRAFGKAASVAHQVVSCGKEGGRGAERAEQGFLSSPRTNAFWGFLMRWDWDCDRLTASQQSSLTRPSLRRRRSTRISRGRERS